MSKLFYSALLQWKLDLRRKEILVVYYIVPLVFFLFMGNIFSTINPLMKDTLSGTMVIFSVSMGALLGTPTPLVEFYGSEMKKAYKVGNIPLWVPLCNNFFSAFVHLSIVSVIISVLSPLLFGKTEKQIDLVFVVTVLGFVCVSIAIGNLLGILTKSEGKVTMLGQVVFLPSIMLSGIMFPRDLLPNFLQKVGQIFPATWAYDALNKDVLGVEVLFLFGFAVVLILLSVFSISKTKEFV